MPELPEVEASRRFVLRHAGGKRIASVQTHEVGGGPRDGLADDIVWTAGAAATAAERLAGCALADAHRLGKHMWWSLTPPTAASSAASPAASPALTPPAAISFHFGMTGAFVARPPGAAAKPQVGGNYKR